MDVFSAIHRLYPSMPPKEQKIADLVIRHGGELQNINITVLAARAGVSAGTVTRFCKSIGCDSFASLKLELSRACSTQEEPGPGDDVFENAYRYYSTIIDHTNRLMDHRLLYRVKEEIVSTPGRICLYGIGSSGLTAGEFALRLLRMGMNVQAITDSHLMLINSELLTANDLAFAVSISGETREVVRAAAVAKAAGCRVISMTSDVQSSLAATSDLCFPIVNTEHFEQMNFNNSQFSAMYVLDMLTSLLLRDSGRRENMQKTVQSILQESHLH